MAPAFAIRNAYSIPSTPPSRWAKAPALGLSAVYGVIQDHNGQITCRNRPEGGALFIVTLPATAEPVAQGAGAAG